MIGDVREISFGPGRTAVAVDASPEAGGEELLSRLDLPLPRGTLVVNGSTAELAPGLAERLAVVFEAGVASVAIDDGLTVITGGTDAGIFSILGRAMTKRVAPLVGVVPHGLVTWPGRLPEDGQATDDDREPLEPHHSHFVLVEGDEWGVETPALMALTRAFDAHAPSVAVICGGGAGARAEAFGHAQASRPILVLGGSGRFADDLAAAVASSPSDDQELAELASGGTVIVCPLSDGPEAVAAGLRAALR
ncbi:MAG: hypothetical protein ABR540_00535 [Acidimicrobiales bacterium]